MAEPVTATVHINAPPERVYQYFTRPEAIVSWMGDHALLEARPGGRFVLDIKGVPVRGHYLQLDPPHRILVSWGYAGSDHLPPGASTVEVRLTACDGGTRVDLEHRDLPADQRPGHVSGWTHYLARLQPAATGQHPGPDPGMPEPRRAQPPGTLTSHRRSGRSQER
ncbi:MAG: SRPBCC domain-containing protein [Streptosporangiaceae bacterium]|nr:SRPBCC domain-containing protein [Streptosporangiaceae bacterium]MBV9853783.1 SRPBCC domain-containing protein [Streptosporangiaceae bacterium]